MYILAATERDTGYCPPAGWCPCPAGESARPRTRRQRDADHAIGRRPFPITTIFLKSDSPDKPPGRSEPISFKFQPSLEKIGHQGMPRVFSLDKVGRDGHLYLCRST
jgi:hypothetical protein